MGFLDPQNIECIVIKNAYYSLIETIKSMAGIPKARGKQVSSPLHSVLRNCGVRIVLIKLPKSKL